MNIYEIAELAGVSVGTVSRVINGKRDVSKITKEKILKIMEENNFTPRISSVRGNTIALFVPLNKERKLSSPYLARTLSGIGDFLFDNDYRLLIVSTDKIPKKQSEFIQFCLQNNIDGGIFVLSSMEDVYIKSIAEKFPVVVVANKFDSGKITCVYHNGYNGSYSAVKHLISLGHRDIMFIYNGADNFDTANRLRGYRDALAGEGIPAPEHFLFGYNIISEIDLELHINNIFKNYKMPTAILIQNDTEALRVMNILDKMNIKVPGDMSIVGFDDLSFSQYANPPLTTVRQPIYDEGAKAAEEIIKMIESGSDYEYRDIVLEPQLVLRSSTAALAR